LINFRYIDINLTKTEPNISSYYFPILSAMLVMFEGNVSL